MVGHALAGDSSMIVENSNSLDGGFSQSIGSLGILVLHKVCHDEVFLSLHLLVLIILCIMWN